MEGHSLTFTSESVSEGHPDKVADQISDAILDACLEQDPYSRVACETLVKNNTVVLAGEITTAAKIDYEAITRNVINQIGYNDAALGFDAKGAKIIHLISEQSPDISMGVTADPEHAKLQGAGDQGLMFGFACDENANLMPTPIYLSHAITKELARLRKEQNVSFLKPDAKSQVSVQYRDGRPERVTAVVVSTQHDESYSLGRLAEYVVANVIKKVVPSELLSNDTKFLINPTGRFVIGGPVGDCGLTGRKIIVDTYGGYARHGGGAFSGKDPSKVDRSACYAARYIAKNIVAAKLAKRCEVQVAYAIGVAEPVSLYVNTLGTGSVADEKLEQAVRKIFDLRPAGIISMLNLLKPIYQQTAAYGHFGRDPTLAGAFPWEKTDKVEALKSAMK